MTIDAAARAGFAVPDTELATAADALARSVSPSFVYNHTVRSYLFARELAAASGLRAEVDYDEELVYVACILHDLGVTEFANNDKRFEVDGADAAAAFLTARGVEPARVQPVWNAIALHTSDGLAPHFGPVEAVTQQGIAADILGFGKQQLPAGFAERVHAAWPRENLGYALGELIAAQVHANPAKGSPHTFPGQLRSLYYKDAPELTWFDFVAAAGWGDPTPAAH